MCDDSPSYTRVDELIEEAMRYVREDIESELKCKFLQLADRIEVSNSPDKQWIVKAIREIV